MPISRSSQNGGHLTALADQKKKSQPSESILMKATCFRFFLANPPACTGIERIAMKMADVGVSGPL